MINEFKFEKTISVHKLGEEPPDWEYWVTRPPLERLAAIEFMRQVMYGYDPHTARISKVVEVVPFPPS